MPQILFAKRDGSPSVSQILKATDDIRKRSGGFLAAVSPSCICSEEQILSAYEKAVCAFASGRSRSRTTEGEFFRILAMEPQIGSAIERCGISEEDSVFCLVYDGVDDINGLLEELGLQKTDFSPCGPERLSEMGFDSMEELLEAMAFFDAGIQ